MTIFERIRNKANQAIQGVGNFIDRDKDVAGVQLWKDRSPEIPGNQLIPGGFQGGVQRVKQSFQEDPGQYSFTRPVQQTLTDLSRNIGNLDAGGYKLKDQIKAYPEAFAQNLPVTPNRQENFNRNVEDILGEKTVPTTLAQGFNNWFAAPLMQVPYNLKEAFGGEDKSTLSRIGHGAQAVFGLLPGVDDAVFAGYNALKGAGTERNISGAQPGLAGNEYYGLGDAVTGGKDNMLTYGLNMAELPLLMFGGLKAKNLDEVLQANLKNADNLKGARNVDEILQGYVKPKGGNAADFITSPGGTTTKVKELSQRATDDILSNITPTKEVGGANGLSLPAGRTPLQLPAPAPKVTTMAQVRKLAKNGDNMDNVRVVAKTADQIREARRLGVSPENIELGTPNQKTLRTLFGTDDGDLMRKLPESQEAFQAGKDAKNMEFKERGVLKKGYDYMMSQTPEKLKSVFGDEFYGKHIDPIFTSIDQSSRKADDFIKQRLTNVADKATEVGINAKTEDSKLLYTLRDKGYNAVVKQVGETKAKQVQDLYNTLRQNYDDVYEQAAPIAESLGKKLPKLDDFLSQQGNKFSKPGLDLLGDKAITDEISSSIFKKQGKVNMADPLEAYTLYMNKVANLIYMEPEAKKFKQLSDSLSQNKNTNKDMLKQLEKVRQSITGEGKEISGAQKLFDDYFGRTKAAAVVGKGSTLINQILGVPAAAGNSGWRNFIAGNLDPKVKALVKEKSALFSSVDRSVPKSLQGGKIHQRIFQGMANALQSANKFGYEVSLRGFVKKAENSGIDPKKIDDIIAMADKEAAKVLGDRREWMNPEFYNTFVGKLFAPFTQEQTAQASSFLRNIGDKKAGIVIKTLIGWKVGNEIWEKVAGFSPFFDPISAAQDTAELWNGSDEKEQSKLKAFMRMAEEALVLAPPIQSIVNQGYSVGDTLGILPDSRDVWANDRTWMSTGSLLNPLSNIKIDFDAEPGEKWLPRNITGNKVADTALNIGAKYIPGLEQVNRTVQASNSLKRGYAESRKGNPLYEMPDTFLGKAQALFFGQNSTKNAQEMFNNDFDWGLYGKQADAMDSIPTKEGKLEFLREARSKNIASKKVDSILKGGNQNVSTDDIKTAVFDNKSARSSSIEERMDVYKGLNTILNDDELPESYKRQVIEASGATTDEVNYYNLASKDQDVRLQELIPKLENMDEQEKVEFLMQGKMKIGGKELVSDTMAQYLYEMDYITKDQMKAIKALEYDEIGNKFYYKKSYTGGGSGGSGSSLTWKQAMKLFAPVELPKFSALKSIDTLLANYSPATSQTGEKSDTLLEDILSKTPKKKDTKSQGYWF